MVVFGSTHGNEPVVLKNLPRELSIEQVVGKLIVVPVLNNVAFGTCTRDRVAADGVNLNRAFVDGAGTTTALTGITHRIAPFVRVFLWPQVHVVIDLHSGGEVARFAHCAIFHHADGGQRFVEIIDRECHIPAPFPGLYEPLLECGAEVVKGDTVGLFTTFTE
jgi:N-alpha-acetyl-L-2,4-diaminobutyrate deacetylase